MKFSSEAIDTKSYTCPSSKISYVGDCPVTTCPLNISVREKGVGGCFLNHNKPDIIQAAYCLGIHTGQAERRYEKALHDGLKIQSILDLVHKERHSNNVCPNCHIDLPIGMNKCTHISSCEKRSLVINKISNEGFFKNPYMSISKNDIWHVIFQSDVINNESLKAARTAYDLPRKGIKR